MFRILLLCMLFFAATAVPCAESRAADPASADATQEAHGSDHGSDAHGDDSHAASGPDPLAFDPDLALWTLVVFAALLMVLKTAAWGPIMRGLEAREESIVGNLDAASAKHDEAKALLAEHEKKLAGAADEVRVLLEEARRDAEHTKEDIVAEAKAAADAERERAVRDIDQARDVVVRQLAEQTAGLAVDLASKVVRQDITPARQGEIVDEALNRFAGSASEN